MAASQSGTRPSEQHFSRLVEMADPAVLAEVGAPGLSRPQLTREIAWPPDSRTGSAPAWRSFPSLAPPAAWPSAQSAFQRDAGVCCRSSAIPLFLAKLRRLHFDRVLLPWIRSAASREELVHTVSIFPSAECATRPGGDLGYLPRMSPYAACALGFCSFCSERSRAQPHERTARLAPCAICP